MPYYSSAHTHIHTHTVCEQEVCVHTAVPSGLMTK